MPRPRRSSPRSWPCSGIKCSSSSTAPRVTALTGPKLFIVPPYDGKTASAGNGVTVAFKVSSRAVVDEFHRVALENGGADASRCLPVGDCAGARGSHIPGVATLEESMSVIAPYDRRTRGHAFTPAHNRCVVFETSEKSWHGVTAAKRLLGLGVPAARAQDLVRRVEDPVRAG